MNKKTMHIICGILIFVTVVILLITLTIKKKEDYNSGEHVMAGNGDEVLQYGKLFLYYDK